MDKSNEDVFEVMAKPCGPLCNLDCVYCFYSYKKNREDPSYNWMMDRETLEIFVRDYIRSQPPGYPVQFVWQGGEPALLGLDFYEEAVELQKKYGGPRQRITNAFQTNATLIDEKWASFFGENKFLLGVSIDGPKEIHDHYRVDHEGNGSFDRVMKGLENLKRYDVDCNALVSITDISSEDPLAIYDFLRAHFEFIKFIPVLANRNFRERAPLLRDGGNPGAEKAEHYSEPATDWSVTPQGFGTFLTTIFDKWVKNDVGKVFVQLFDYTLANWLGYPVPLCILNRTCGKALVMEHNGDIFSCDHFVFPEFRLGNIKETPLAELARGPAQTSFGRDKWERLPGACRNCEHLRLCFGGCPKNRFSSTAGGEGGLNYLCEGYRAFFGHTGKAMKFMANEIANQRPAANIMNSRV
ncbi:MAG: anaerobic sulfatase maturase [Deltaproteobacteria bacterium]|nr:anaerobic sulfatase maturase [Deltaproteobacteria bacterium]